MAGARGLWRATGMTDSDFGKPIIAVVNSFTQFVPGHVHLKDLGQMVACEIENAGGVAKEFNLLLRDLVRQKLSGATKVCTTYTLNVQPETVQLSCDDRPTVALQRDGSPLHTQNQAGEPVRGTVQVQGNTLRLIWQGESGGRTNVFSLQGDTLVLQAEVRSKRIPKPLRWTVDYAR